MEGWSSDTSSILTRAVPLFPLLGLTPDVLSGTLSFFLFLSVFSSSHFTIVTGILWRYCGFGSRLPQ